MSCSEYARADPRITITQALSEFTYSSFSCQHFKEMIVTYKHIILYFNEIIRLRINVDIVMDNIRSVR